MFPDALALLVTGLKKQLGSAWVADRLPDPIESALPAVWINPVPGGSMHAPWNDSAPLTDAPSFDIDILGQTSKGPKALNDFAAEVREALVNLSSTTPAIKRVIEDVPLTKRPDWNPKVLRVGGEYALIISRR